MLAPPGLAFKSASTASLVAMTTQPNDAAISFIAAHPHAAMITVGGDGRPRAVKIEAAMVDGVLESASHADKLRTRRLRRDPRCSLYFADEQHAWLSLDVGVTIIDGEAAARALVRFFRVRDERPTGPLDYHSDRSHHLGLSGSELEEVLAAEEAVLFRFTVERQYGNL